MQFICFQDKCELVSTVLPNVVACRFNEKEFPSEWLRSDRKNEYENTGDVEAALARSHCTLSSFVINNMLPDSWLTIDMLSSFHITVDMFEAPGLCAMVEVLFEQLPSWPLALQVLTLVVL